MTTLDRTAIRPTATRGGVSGLFKRSLDRIIAADAAWRERQQMRRLTDEMLRDMGLSRRDAETGGR